MVGPHGIQLTPLDRVIVGAAGLFLALLGLDVAASGLGWQGPASFSALWEAWGLGLWEALALGALLLAAGVYLLLLPLRREDDEGIRQETEMGHVRISLRAIENLVRRVASEVRGIKDVEVEAHPSPEGVAVHLYLVVHPDTSIPEICDDVGRRVRSQVRETVGVDVGDVSRRFATSPPETGRGWSEGGPGPWTNGWPACWKTQSATGER